MEKFHNKDGFIWDKLYNLLIEWFDYPYYKNYNRETDMICEHWFDNTELQLCTNAVKELRKQKLFSDWKIKPKIRVKKLCDQFAILISHDNSKNMHEAANIVLAFINGFEAGLNSHNLIY